MALKGILVSAARGLKFFPTTTHYDLVLFDNNPDGKTLKEKHVVQNSKLCTGAFSLSLKPSLANIHGLRPAFEFFANTNKWLFSHADSSNIFQNVVIFTSGVPSRAFNVYEEKTTTSSEQNKEPVISERSVQADETSSKHSDLKILVDELKADMHNMLAVMLFENGYFEDAVCHLHSAVKLGSIRALFNLGCYYCFWKDPEVDFDKGAGFFSLASNRGHVQSMYNLGALNLRKLLRHSDTNSGVELIEEAAKLGCSEAQFHMGKFMLQLKHYSRAEFYFSKLVHIDEYKSDLISWLSVKDIPVEVHQLLKKLLRNSAI
ncbi:unnamed protein product [Thelazia callipaeda]|uniref:TPR_REGION domain-containing protein n=1 Tax=Thelazia callipaeda TaxID=103827 RepID=A0A0N5D0W3_THECL|nr:unnamed protein product [Thelazia callipaeda]